MENNNFNLMMMGINNQMMMDMNNQLMGGMNNPMMMNMNNQMIGGMNNPMMDMPPMNNMNIPQNMGMMGVMNCCNFPLNNFGFNNLYNLDNDRINNSNCKFVRLYYNNEFIQNVTIFNQDNYTSISNTFKQILFSYGKKSYRGARPEETIERSSPNETLEFLINRGVFEENPSVQIINKTRYRNYYNSPNNMFEDIQNGDELKVEYLSKIYGGLCSIDFIDIDKLTKTKKLKFSKEAPKWRKVSIGLNLFGKCINKKCKAFNEEVIHPVGINVKFDFNSDDRKNIKCPICSKNFVPITMGFWKFEYQIKGEKLKNGDYKKVNLNGKETKGDDFEYFDPYKNETVSWSKLMIFTGHRQKMKYEEKEG